MIERFLSLRAGLSREDLDAEVERLLPELYRTARGYVREPADAEDLVHEACLKAFAAFGQTRVRSLSACRVWLHRILLNTFRDRYRRSHRSPVVASASDDNVVELAVSSEPQPDERLHYRGFAEAADAALERLPPEIRVVTALFLLHELPYARIAEIADCPVGTVMSRLSRGRQRLRKALGAYVEDAPQRRRRTKEPG